MAAGDPINAVARVILLGLGSVAVVMFVALNNKGEVTLVNEKGCEILGYGQSEIIPFRIVWTQMDR